MIMRRKQGNIILKLWRIIRVCTHFWTKNSRTFQGHISHFSRTPFSAKKEPSVYIFCSWTTWAISSWRPFNLCLLLLSLATRESGLDKGSTEIQGLSSTDCNFQGLSRSVQTLNNVRCPKDLNVKMSRLFNLIK